MVPLPSQTVSSPTSVHPVEYEEPILYPIPGKSAKRNEVTHKTLDKMNRQERRAFEAVEMRRMRKRALFK